MENGHGRHGRDGISAQLRELLAASGVDVDEAVHVADAEALRGGGGRVGLPLGSEAVLRVSG